MPLLNKVFYLFTPKSTGRKREEEQRRKREEEERKQQLQEEQRAVIKTILDAAKERIQKAKDTTVSPSLFEEIKQQVRRLLINILHGHTTGNSSISSIL